MKTRVDVEKVEALFAARAAINVIPLEDIEWFEGGKPIAIPDGAVNDFINTGFSNVDFVQYRFWEPGAADPSSAVSTATDPAAPGGGGG